MVKFVENELLSIRKEIRDMWTLVYEQLDNAYKSLLETDIELAARLPQERNASTLSN